MGGNGKMRVKYLPVAEGRRLHIEVFPNFSASGSIKGMKDKFYGKNALLVKCGSYIYNVGNAVCETLTFKTNLKPNPK